MKSQQPRKKLEYEKNELRKTGITIFKRIKLLLLIVVVIWILAAILILLLLVKYINKDNVEPNNLPEFAQTFKLKQVN